MCGKTEIESMKHQLEALGVYRPKIAAVRREFIAQSSVVGSVEGSVDGVIGGDSAVVDMIITTDTATAVVADVSEEVIAETENTPDVEVEVEEDVEVPSKVAKSAVKAKKSKK